MKKTVILLAASVLFLAAFKSATTDKSQGTVTSQKGVYIFLLCKPSAENEYLGTVEKFIPADTQEYQIEEMVDKAKKKYPNAQGIVFSSLKLDRADVIKFKE